MLAITAKCGFWTLVSKVKQRLKENSFSVCPHLPFSCLTFHHKSFSGRRTCKGIEPKRQLRWAINNTRIIRVGHSQNGRTREDRETTEKAWECTRACTATVARSLSHLGVQYCEESRLEKISEIPSNLTLLTFTLTHTLPLATYCIRFLFFCIAVPSRSSNATSADTTIKALTSQGWRVSGG